LYLKETVVFINLPINVLGDCLRPYKVIYRRHILFLLQWVSNPWGIYMYTSSKAWRKTFFTTNSCMFQTKC